MASSVLEKSRICKITALSAINFLTNSPAKNWPKKKGPRRSFQKKNWAIRQLIGQPPPPRAPPAPAPNGERPATLLRARKVSPALLSKNWRLPSCPASTARPFPLSSDSASVFLPPPRAPELLTPQPTVGSLHFASEWPKPHDKGAVMAGNGCLLQIC